MGTSGSVNIITSTDEVLFSTNFLPLSRDTGVSSLSVPCFYFRMARYSITHPSYFHVLSLLIHFIILFLIAIKFLFYIKTFFQLIVHTAMIFLNDDCYVCVVTRLKIIWQLFMVCRVKSRLTEPYTILCFRFSLSFWLSFVLIFLCSKHNLFHLHGQISPFI